MRIDFFCAWWGLDHLGLEGMVARVAELGYDGIETFVPGDAAERSRLGRAIEAAGLACIAHQYEADGSPERTRSELIDNLRRAGELGPVLVNSHTGRDHWTAAAIDPLIDAAADLEDELGVPVLHETHRSRFPYSLAVTLDYLQRHPTLRLTADLSHWACVSESLLEDQADELETALARSVHVHARVGWAQGAQVPDPAAPRWSTELDTHVDWWRRIRDHRRTSGAEAMTITTEIGPPPYMPVDPTTGAPIADFVEQNVWLREHLRAELALS